MINVVINYNLMFHTYIYSDSSLWVYASLLLFNFLDILSLRKYCWVEIAARYLTYYLVSWNINLNWQFRIYSIVFALTQLVVEVEAPTVQLLLLLGFVIFFGDSKAMSASCFDVVDLDFILLKPWNLRHSFITGQICSFAQSAKVSFATYPNVTFQI